MRIDLNSIDREQFIVAEKDFRGHKVYLVQPQHVGCKWTQANKIFRSSVWAENGELLSGSFFKFPNWGENPDHFPIPKDLNKANIVEKLDGSLLIYSPRMGFLRTRGTVDAYSMENSFELDILKEKYPKVFQYDLADKSLLFEWLSPTNQIVIKHAEPDIRLVGGVNHLDYSLFTQFGLDALAEELGVARPRRFQFQDHDSLVDSINKIDDFEGVCIYSKDDQSIHKVKTLKYLKLHQFKEHASLESVVELFCASGYPKYGDFCSIIESQFDFECLQIVSGFVSQVCDAHKEVLTIIDGFRNFIAKHGGESRKEFALKVISAYGNTNRASFVFTLKDRGELDVENVKKLIWQALKKG